MSIQTEFLLPATPKGMEARPPEMIQIGPGRWAPKNKAQVIPETVLAKVLPDGRGGYTLLPLWDHYTRLTEGVLKRLGMPGGRRTIIRLISAGFLEGIKISPQCYLLNLTSWSMHLNKCAEDPEFWDEGSDNMKRYRKALEY